MKKAISLISIGTILLVLTACSGSKSTNADKTATQMDNAITSAQFGKAAGYNQALINQGSKQGSANLGKQLNLAIKAQKYEQKYKYGKAAATLKKAQKIDTKNKTLTTLLKHMRTSSRHYAAQYKQIKQDIKEISIQAKNGQNAAALKLINNLVAEQPEITKPEFYPLYVKTLTLKSDLLSKTNGPAATSKTTTTTTDSTKKTTSNSSSTDSTSSSTSSVGNDSTSANASSNSSITSADIKAARDDLRKAGSNPDYWSDGDIEQAITNARADGRTHITASDINQ